MPRQCLDIELVGADRLGDGAPDAGQQHGADDRADGHRGIDQPELALFHAADDQALEQRQTAADHFLEVEATDLGKGAGSAGKDVGVGTGKGAAKIGKGTGKGIGKLGKKIFGKGGKDKEKSDE